VAVVCALFFASLVLSANYDADNDDAGSQSSVIINRYLQATQFDSSKDNSVEVDIDASVPRFNQHGRLRALRKISDVGKITYRVLGFQGDNTVKNQVIARYLQAEQEGQDNKKLNVTPANYKFKLKSEQTVANGQQVYVFQVKPRAKRVGLFKGEVWLDAKTCLPVMEKGRLVKNPSIFFRKVDFERDFAILNGQAVPAHMSSTIDTRLVGKVNLNVAYSNQVATSTVNTVDVESPAVSSSF
jgi:hypothetical protein